MSCSARECAVVIDGNALTYRAYYATINQIEYFLKNGIKPNNAIKLMLIMSLKILQEFNPKYALIAFDTGRKTFRHDIFDQYKANRAKAPNELIDQIKILPTAILLCGYNVYLQEGIEADDIIGSFAELTKKNNIVCKIFSSDKDMLQLVNSLTEVYMPKKGISEMVVYNNDNFLSLMDGLKPNQITDYKGIVGDASDNLPGIKGIGKKTGIKLLKEFNSLDNIFNNLDKLSKSQQKLFLDFKDIAIKCKNLSTIKQDIFFNKKISDFLRTSIQIEKLFSFFHEYKINNMEKYVFNN
ncbi:5'-3' exonuclease [Mycoplasmoides alvi]|uniref:5'-3' exonuclease n=1 Tax=Mycoplasmoides alvi TaxID=78580 RepID=UPI00051B8BE0|nr:5'-3' exonuclease [Mycoplasmoides alvi]